MPERNPPACAALSSGKFAACAPTASARLMSRLKINVRAAALRASGASRWRRRQYSATWAPNNPKIPPDAPTACCQSLCLSVAAAMLAPPPAMAVAAKRPSATAGPNNDSMGRIRIHSA